MARQLDTFSFGGTTAVHDRRHAEVTIAVGRAFFAVAAFGAITLASESAGNTRAAELVLGGYVLFAVILLALLRFRPEIASRTGLGSHLVDIGVATAVTFFTHGTTSPFFVLFLFTLLTAAYRWGFAETVATACAAVALLLLELLVERSIRDPRLAMPPALEPERLLMRCTYLLVTGVLTGYLAQSEKLLRLEVSAIAAIANRADVRGGVTKTMAAVYDGMLRLFSATRASLIVHDRFSDQVFLWQTDDPANGTMRLSRVDHDRLSMYMFVPQAAAWYAVRRRMPAGDRFDVVALDADGARLPTNDWTLPSELLAAIGPFDRLMAVNVALGSEWAGRTFLVDPVETSDKISVLGFARRLVRHIAPAVQNVYLMHRLRSSAAALERGRLARELHDGVIQTVTGVEIQVAALSHRMTREAPAIASELTRLDQLLREEVIHLRELMQQVKPLDIGPNQLVDVLAEFVSRFERETGITARFVTQLDRVPLTPRACRDFARVLQEALINVRRHSGARNVTVRLSTDNGDCRMLIDDDGRGFPFEGRLSLDELEATRKGPIVITERIRELGGDLTVESVRDQGARLEITVPLSPHSMHSLQG